MRDSRLAVLMDDLMLLRELYTPSLAWTAGAVATVIGGPILFL
ncbi:MAG: hypothetical protein AAGD38_07895 [Acidobacteriota bacterium]